MDNGDGLGIEETINEIKDQKSTDFFVFVLAVVSLIGFGFSLFFLVGITGAAVGNARGNFFGLILVVIFLLVWVVAGLVWMKNKRRERIDVKKLIEDLKKEES